MDGGCGVVPSVLSPQHTSLLRITRGKSTSGQEMPARIFNLEAEKPVAIPWPAEFGEKVFGRIRKSERHGTVWIVLQKDELDGPSKLGLAISVIRPQWVNGFVDVEKFVDGEWIEVSEKDWGAFNATGASA